MKRGRSAVPGGSHRRPAGPRAIIPAVKKMLAKATDRPTLHLLVTFLALNALALFCAWLFTLDRLGSRFFMLGRDRGLGELVETAAFAMIIYMLLAAYRSTGQVVYRAWLILFSIMVADNLLSFHEAVAKWAAGNFPIPALIFRSGRDLTEFVLFAAVEGVAFLYVGISYLRSDASARRESHALLALLALFLVFALVIDATGPSWIEEPGEMLSITLMLAWVHRVHRQHPERWSLESAASHRERG